MILLVFHLDILGKDIKDEQLLNKLFILVILLVIHLEISGSSINDEQL